MNDQTIYYVVGFFFSGFIGAMIGANKGNSAIGFVLGLILGPIGWLLIYVIGSSGGKDCPFCAEKIKEEARICRHCGKEMPGMMSRKGPFVT